MRWLAAVVVLALLAVGLAGGGDLSALTSAIADAEGEIRESVFPALAGVFGALILIGLAGLVVNRIGRGG